MSSLFMWKYAMIVICNVSVIWHNFLKCPIVINVSHCRCWYRSSCTPQLQIRRTKTCQTTQTTPAQSEVTTTWHAWERSHPLKTRPWTWSSLWEASCPTRSTGEMVGERIWNGEDVVMMAARLRHVKACCIKQRCGYWAAISRHWK